MVTCLNQAANRASRKQRAGLLCLVTVIWFAATGLLAQGYIYTFHATNGPSALDGSYIVLSNAVPGAPAFADLLDVKLLDSYLTPVVFDVTVTAQGFGVTSFGPTGFNGSISGSAQSYFPPTGVILTGMDSTPGITASNNGYFPGNPVGEAVFGVWVASPIPEPSCLVLVFAGAMGLMVLRWGRRWVTNDRG